MMNGKTYTHLYQMTTEEAEAEAQRIRPQGDYRLECLGAGPDYRGTWVVDWTKYVVVTVGHMPGEVLHRDVSIVELGDNYDSATLLKEMPSYSEDYIFAQAIEFKSREEAEAHRDYLLGAA